MSAKLTIQQKSLRVSHAFYTQTFISTHAEDVDIGDERFNSVAYKNRIRRGRKRVKNQSTETKKADLVEKSARSIAYYFSMHP